MSDLLYEVKDKIATITLNRPDKLNAFTGSMIDAWARALAEAQADDNVNVVIVTGAGRAFCSGGDVGRMRQGEPSALDGKNSLWEGVHRVPKTLEAMDKPVIAMVNGLAVGAGMGMCVMCDMRVAAESARFSTGYVRVGLVPGDGDTYFLPRLVGAAKALELLWTADFIEAPEAHRLGIVQRVVPDAQLREVTYALARQIADGPQIPMRMIKRLVYQSASSTRACGSTSERTSTSSRRTCRSCARRPTTPRASPRSRRSGRRSSRGAEARARQQHHLGLDDEREQASRRVGDARLPHHGGPAPVERRRGGAHGALARAREEVGLRLERRRGGALRQVEERGRGRDGVGQGHDRSAVEPAADRLEVVADRELGDHAIRGRLDEAHAEQLGEAPLVMRGQSRRVDRHDALTARPG